MKISWDVAITEQGFTRCNLELHGKGFRFFDLRNGWDYGMFLKGDTES